MSYDLELFRKKGLPPLAVEEIQKVGALIPHAKVSDNQLIFDLPESEHSIIFDFEDMDALLEEDEIEASYEYSGLVLDMHIAWGSVRATDEVYPKICDFLARKLNLTFYDPQSNMEMPTDAFASTSATWKGEKKAIAILHEMRRSPSDNLPSECTEYLRKYAGNRDAIEGKWLLGDIYVPNIIVLKSVATGESFTAVVWPNFMPMVLPEVEYIVTWSKPAGLMGLLSSGKIGVAKLADLEAALGESLTCYKDPIPHYLCRPDKHPDIRTNAQRVPLMPLKQSELVSAPESDSAESVG